MITVALSTTIAAPPARIWRALTDPTERSLWDRRLLGEVRLRGRHGSDDATGPQRSTLADAHSALSRRWRFRLGGVPLVLREDRIESDPGSRLATRVSIGTLTFDQILTLHRTEDRTEDLEDDGTNGEPKTTPEDGTAPRTRLGIRIAAGNSIAVVDAIVPRLDVQKLVMEYADATLQQVRAHCEASEREDTRAAPDASRPIDPVG